MHQPESLHSLCDASGVVTLTNLYGPDSCSNDAPCGYLDGYFSGESNPDVILCSDDQLCLVISLCSTGNFC